MTGTKTLGQTIRARRQSLGLTQEELAERIGEGVRQAEVSRLERDKVTLPRRRRLERIAVALELQVGDLLARAGWAGADSAFPSAGGRDARDAPTSRQTESLSGVKHDHLTERPVNRENVSTQLSIAIERSNDIGARTLHLLAESHELAAVWSGGRPRRLHPDSR